MIPVAFFLFIRNYVNQNGIEPREGFVSNNLTVEAGRYLLSIEGRLRGTGFVTVRLEGVEILSQSDLHFKFDSALALDVIAEMVAAEAPASAHAHLANGAGECELCGRMVA